MIPYNNDQEPQKPYPVPQHISLQPMYTRGFVFIRKKKKKKKKRKVMLCKKTTELP